MLPHFGAGHIGQIEKGDEVRPEVHERSLHFAPVADAEVRSEVPPAFFLESTQFRFGQFIHLFHALECFLQVIFKLFLILHCRQEVLRQFDLSGEAEGLFSFNSM